MKTGRSKFFFKEKLKSFWQLTFPPYFCIPIDKKRPVRLSARTAPFHGAKTGSIPVPGTKGTQIECLFALAKIRGV